MAKLTAPKRAALPNKDFALRAQRKFPVQDKVHAAVAKSYAAQEAGKGIISQAVKATIDGKANAVLKK